MSNFFKGELYFNAKISSAMNSPATALPAATKKTFKGTSFTENISEVGENIFHVHSACTTVTAIADSLVTELIIALLFFRCAQNIIGFRGFLELVFRFLVVRVFIRMIFQSHLPVSFFYFSFRRI